MSSDRDWVLEVLRDVPVDFDRGRNITHPCTFCAAPASPHHELVTIGKYCNGKSLTRPVCAKCMPIARAIVASGEQP